MTLFLGYNGVMNKKIIAIAGIIILIFALVLTWNKFKTKPVSPSASKPTIESNSDSPRIVSTKPDPLENTIVSADQVIEITFNRPLQNKGEFKLRIEPKIGFNIELSGDRKTAKIKPLKPYELGTEYTIFIGTDTKFDGAGAWGQEKIFHFKTVTYRGV